MDASPDLLILDIVRKTIKEDHQLAEKLSIGCWLLCEHPPGSSAYKKFFVQLFFNIGNHGGGVAEANVGEVGDDGERGVVAMAKSSEKEKEM